MFWGAGSLPGGADPGNNVVKRLDNGVRVRDNGSMTTTQPLQLPASTAKGGWTVNPAAVREAIAFFGLTRPVRIKLAGGTRRHGSRRWNEATGHSITLSTYLPAGRVSETLWHELCHAAQSEYLGDAAFSASYDQYSKRVGYRLNPYEVEARETGAAMAPEFPLVRDAFGRTPAYVARSAQ